MASRQLTSKIPLMHIESFGETDVGMKRENNQDSFLIKPDLGLFVLADGMGGHNGGEVASSLAVQCAHEVVERRKPQLKKINYRELIIEIFEESCRRIYDMSQKSTGLRGMGTTMVVCLIHEDTLYIGNVGDSRAYLLTKEGLWQMTEDHSLMYEQLRAGLITEKDVPFFVSKNMITRSVGYEPTVNCDILEKKLEPGDRVLLCSDGLSGLVTDRRISELVWSGPEDKVVPHLIAEAKKNGGDDNVTVILLCAKAV